MEERQIQELVQSIRTYLSQRPDAADTLEGITRWWVRSASLDLSPQLVEAALEILIQEGVVTTTHVGGRLLYRGARSN